MAVKLVVSSTINPAESRELVSEEKQITIGRHGSNIIVLPDERRIVSNHHAEIRVGEEVCELIDLGSKNFTYLNEERLQAGVPQPLNAGDVIRIGDFEIKFSPVVEEVAAPDSAPLDYERTVFDFNFVNPFEDDAALLAASVRSIRKAYDEEVPSRRDDALIEAITQALGTDIDHEAVMVIARCLGRPQAADPDTAKPAEMREEDQTPWQIAPQRERASAVRKVPSEPSLPSSSRGGSETRLGRVQDAMFRSFAKIAGIPWQFRHEFIGQTIVQSPGTAFLFENDADLLRERLTDPSIPDELFNRRLTALEEAAEDLAVHQVAMLDGYKASVQKGAERLIEEIDPEKTSREIQKTSKLYEIFPILGASATLKFLKQKCKELQQEDWSIAERRVFRPAFIKAYLARMTSYRRHDQEEL